MELLVTWEEDEEQRVSSLEDLDRLLDVLADRFRGTPTVASVERVADGDSLAICLGEDSSLLNFVAGSGDPPYYSSMGDRPGEELFAFRFGGQYSELPERYLIPIEAARAAMRHFCLTGELSPEVMWEQD